MSWDSFCRAEVATLGAGVSRSSRGSGALSGQTSGVTAAGQWDLSAPLVAQEAGEDVVRAGADELREHGWRREGTMSKCWETRRGDPDRPLEGAKCLKCGSILYSTEYTQTATAPARHG